MDGLYRTQNCHGCFDPIFVYDDCFRRFRRGSTWCLGGAGRAATLVAFRSSPILCRRSWQLRAKQVSGSQSTSCGNRFWLSQKQMDQKKGAPFVLVEAASASHVFSNFSATNQSVPLGRSVCHTCRNVRKQSSTELSFQTFHSELILNPSAWWSDS